jgi:nucleoside 2-deoxyribosyltransferase
MNKVFEGDLEAIRNSDVLLMILDGRAPDEGACFELGYAYSLNKVCVGLQTDVRRLLTIGNNPMIVGALTARGASGGFSARLAT